MYVTDGVRAGLCLDSEWRRPAVPTLCLTGVRDGARRISPAERAAALQLGTLSDAELRGLEAGLQQSGAGRGRGIRAMRSMPTLPERATPAAQVKPYMRRALHTSLSISTVKEQGRARL